jgi:hypothetical protein
MKLYSESDNPLQEIAIQISREKLLGKSSFYRPLFEVLPEDVSYIPAAW